MQRLPPNQDIVTDFPVLHIGRIPEFDKKTWDFRAEGLVEYPIKLNYDEFLALERKISVSDFHCVKGWSVLDLEWEGVLFMEIVRIVKPAAGARFASIEADGGYTTSLPVMDLLREDVIFAYNLNGKPLEPVHGGPLRIVIPKKYAYKSA
ncbi:MAG TPA: molybdopterin-dependent oxidoreductase, partial [Candidatus Methanoperedenaceae archaeon]|nr:molybdopterin-dependent oxidoreductase [Candidatus Methanoperedenaceae archaeon]